MERKELLENIAPCSLMCYTCGGYKNGAICKLAGELSGYLEGIYEFYEKHSGPEQKSYLERFQIFQEELTRMGEAGCGAAGTVNITDAVSAAVSFWNV